MLIYLQDQISSNYKDSDRYLYTHCVQYANSYDLVPGTTTTVLTPNTVILCFSIVCLLQF